MLKPRVPAALLDTDLDGRAPSTELSPSLAEDLRFPWRVAWQLAEESPSLQSNIERSRAEKSPFSLATH